MKLSHTLIVPFLSFAPLLITSGAQAEEAHGNVNADNKSLPAVAANSPAGAFGDKAQLTVSSDAGLEISSRSVSGVSGTTTKLILRPAIDYFVARNISLGGFLGVDYTSANGGHTTQFSIGPRVGYNFAFSEMFSFWPKLGFSYSTTSSSTPVLAPGLPAGTEITKGASGSSLALKGGDPRRSAVLSWFQ